MARESRELLSAVYPVVDRALSDRARGGPFFKHIADYFDRNSDVLNDYIIGMQLYFKDDDKDLVFRMTGLTKADVLAAIKRAGQVKSGWVILNKPEIWAYMMAARHCLLSKKEKEMYQVLMYLTLDFYSSLVYRQFKYEVNRNCMEYTVSNLSNKFYLKKFKTLWRSLEETLRVCHETYEPLLRKGDDLSVQTYLVGLRTRISSFVVNIAREYYKNKEEGRYLNKEGDVKDDEEYREVENVSTAISKAAQKAAMHVVSIGVDEKVISFISSFSTLPKASIRTAVQDIVGKKGSEVASFVTLILQSYLVNHKNEEESILSKKFILDNLSNYAKSNTNEEAVVRMKDMLDKWLSECSEKYSRTNRAATKGEFRKALFMYFVLSIQQSYK